MRIYARLSDGKLERIRALASSCPVRANGSIQDLGAVADDASARWLGKHLTADARDAEVGRRLRGDAMAALGAHRTDIAHATLVDIARKDERIEHRKDALFWLAQLRGRAGADVATSIMFEDANPQIREHATLAVAHSQSPRIANDLTRVGKTDASAQVRGQAWFWLGQKGFPETEQAIGAALRTEEDRHVREQAIFALSQLPAERATNALIAIAESRSLDREDRKRAIFWLAHEGSDSAVAYLDRIMASPSRR
jgi:HEAT repeat protein